MGRDKGTGETRPARVPREASRRADIDSFIVMDVMSRAAQREAAGASVIHMEVGQPGTAAPFVARQAVREALERQTLGYTLALGTDALRTRIARHYHDCYGIALDPGRVIVTTGSSGAFVLAFLALIDAGERVATAAPGYPCYRQILSALGCEPVTVATGPASRWALTAADLAALHNERRLGAVLIASPANPTGTMIDGARLSEIAAFCRSAGVWLISDEIYHGLTYAAPAETALASDPDAVVINSFSKYYSMTGWRVGWMVVPERLVRPIERLQQNLFIAPPAVAQVAALAAFEAGEELEANRRAYARNRDILLAELPGAGLGALAPADGAFYLYADVSGHTDDARGFVDLMLAETGVAATPGIDFDGERGHRFVRFSYAGTTEAIVEAVARLKAWPRLGGRT